MKDFPTLKKSPTQKLQTILNLVNKSIQAHNENRVNFTTTQTGLRLSGAIKLETATKQGNLLQNGLKDFTLFAFTFTFPDGTVGDIKFLSKSGEKFTPYLFRNGNLRSRNEEAMNDPANPLPEDDIFLFQTNLYALDQYIGRTGKLPREIKKNFKEMTKLANDIFDNIHIERLE